MKRTAVAIFITAAVVGVFVYLVIVGRTDSWPTTDCTIVESRVVRDDGPYGPMGSVMVLYKGEYQLRYHVNDQDYRTWVNAGWEDKDPKFVESKVSYLPESCPYIVRYNPKNPAETVTDWKVQ